MRHGSVLYHLHRTANGQHSAGRSAQSHRLRRSPAEYFDIHAHNEQYWMHTGARVREATPARQHAAAASPNAENAPLPLIAYSVERGIEISLEPAPSGRDWMDVAPQRFAYRCLPLLMANQAG